ncbi:MAG: hypothetical protein JWR23_843 [Mucilaginibacter sp.]|nr:hypothetical protein [Mucilaginibacter sp.]
MQTRDYRRFYIFLLVFAVQFLCTGNSFAKNLPSHKQSAAVSQLKASHHSNHEMVLNGNNQFQLLNYRTVKSGHFIKIFLIDLLSIFVCLKYLKNKLKSIYSEYARFLKLLLYPNHVFW